MMSIKPVYGCCALLWLSGPVVPATLATADPGSPGTDVAAAGPPSSGARYEDAQVAIRIVTRDRDQLAAFYLGRQFNQAAIDSILETCFLTPIIHNKSLDVLWLELDEWGFSRGQQVITRLGRDYWPPHWRQAGLPQGHQSTFGWTLLPEVRDLRQDESAGGSVVIPWQDQPFTMTMRFHTDADKQGPIKTVVFEDLECVP